MPGSQFSIGSALGKLGLPSFDTTKRIANGTGDRYVGRKDGTGPKDVGQQRPKRKKRKRRKVNVKKIKGL